MSETLSQKEIDALIASAIGQEPAGSSGGPLTHTEIDTLGEIGNISMGAAATALYAILGRQVNITTPDVSVTTLDKLAQFQTLPFVVVDVGYTEGFAGSSLFILRLDDVRVITDIMMGGDGHPDEESELTELHISAISEAMNQMMGGMSTSMAEMFNRIVNISPPKSIIARLSDREISSLINRENEELICISFKMVIDGILDSSIMQLLPVYFGRQLVAELFGQTSAQADVLPSSSGPAGQPAAAQRTNNPARQSVPVPAPMSRPAPAPRAQPAIDIRPIQLTSFDEPSPVLAANMDSGIGLILDVPLQITVELGQCRKTIKEILDLNIGSVVTLDKLAGEPVDVVVNGKAVAKGEVIVIDDSYGIRITEVLTGAGRARTTR